MARHFIGIDVGTGSARAGVFDEQGRLLGSGKRDISLWRAPGGVAEQSSQDIWQAVCTAVRRALQGAGCAAADISGIGFDATCSMVVAGKGGRPLAVGAGGPESDSRERDIIVWMDQRAADQAARINAGDHAVLAYVGGRISPEMQTPKLLWLKENRPETWAAAWQFFDLADWLGWRATGSLARSGCTVSCKWTWLAHENRWDPDYFRAIGLADLADEGFARIGTDILAPGTPLSGGLTAEAAEALGLAPGTPVGAGLIDAHAGGVGSLGAPGPDGSAPITRRMAYVFGTSACTMSSSAGPAFVPGIWGPYYAAMVPGLWLNEGGQSLAGAAIDQLMRLHPARAEALRAAEAAGLGLPDWLGRAALDRAGSASGTVRLAEGLHVVPDFLGNRSPMADPAARAVISGLGIDSDPEHMAALYVAGICALGYGLRQIADAQREKGVETDTIVISGGAGQNPLVRQLLADSTGIPVALPGTAEPVLLGAAMLGAVAAAAQPDLQSAMAQMSGLDGQLLPDPGTAALHRRRYRIFALLQEAEYRSRRIEAEADS